MKRHRSEANPPETCEIERKVIKLRRRSDSVSSSHVRGRHSGGGGVVAATTVTAATPMSSSTHQPPASSTSQTHADHHQGRTTLRKPPHSTSTMLPKLVKEALVSGSVDQLYEYIDIKFVSTQPSSETWAEECEALVAASFVSLLWEKSGIWLTRIKLLFQDFCERWHENGNIEDLLTDCTDLQKSSLLGCLILVVDILECSNLNVKILNQCLTWPSREIPPRWLSDVCGITQGGYSDINILLYAVSSVLKGENLKFDYINSYTGSLLCLLTADHHYRKGHYNESLKALNNLTRDNQGDDLLGWIQWISGINLLHIGKHHSALLKLQTAIDSSDLCSRALFTVSQLFHSIDQKAAELETLSLLAVADHSVERHNHNLQSCLLERLHPRNPEVNEVALFLLAARCLQQKMYKDASKKFNELLNKLKNPAISKRPCQTLLRPQDDIPHMPEDLCLNILAGCAEFKNGNYKEAILIIGNITSIEKIKFFESGTKEKVLCFSAVCGHLVRIKSYMDMNHLKEALAACIELENMMTWTPGNVLTGWSQILLRSKCALYQTAAILHSNLQHDRNAVHYQRLSAQCNGAITADKSKMPVKDLIGTEEWMCLSLSHQIVIENHYDFFIELAEFVIG